MNNQPLTGKNAIVTGGSRGIGRAIVLSLAKQGAHVLFSYNSNEQAARAVEEAAKAQGGTVTALRSDSTRVADIAALFARAKELFNGRIDIVVCSAFPSAVFKPTAFLSEAEYDSMHAGAKGIYFTLQQAAQHIADHGRIVVLSSGAAGMATPASGAYAGAKSAVERFALSAAKELGAKQVSVNVVAPGVVRTDGLVAPQEMIDMLVAQTPLGRLGEPDDVAHAVTLLTLPNAGWISAQVVHANGGLM
ncbi:MAG: SDR family oxidoreductase [Flavobacteriales bacterium]